MAVWSAMVEDHTYFELAVWRTGVRDAETPMPRLGLALMIVCLRRSKSASAS